MMPSPWQTEPVASGPKPLVKDGVVGKRDAGSVVVGLHSMFGNVIDEIVVGMAACVCEINPNYVSTAAGTFAMFVGTLQTMFPSTHSFDAW